MTFGVPAEEYEVHPAIEKAMDRIFILHADHEQNASTSTVRLAGSSGANPFACIAAGIACLWGPAHGGANEAALNMLKEIGHPDRIPEYIARAKDKANYALAGAKCKRSDAADPISFILMKDSFDKESSGNAFTQKGLQELKSREQEVMEKGGCADRCNLVCGAACH